MFRSLPPFGGDARQTAEVVRGIMDGKTNNTGALELAVGWATQTTLVDPRVGGDSIIQFVPISDSAAHQHAPYGAFSDTTTQTTASSTTINAMAFNTTDFSHGVYIASGSRITVRNAGTYNLQYSSQFVNVDSAIMDVSIWLRVNGVDVPGSRGDVAVPNRHGSIDGHALPAWNYFIEMAAGDYAQLMWSSNTDVSMAFLPTATSPTRPAAVSVIASMDFISTAASTEVWASSKGKGTATISHFANNVAGKIYGYTVTG